MPTPDGVASNFEIGGRGRSLCCNAFALMGEEPGSSTPSSSLRRDSASIGRAACREAVIEGVEPSRMARRNVSVVEDQTTLQRVTRIL